MWVVGQDRVERSHQVAGRVGQRPVEIEDDDGRSIHGSAAPADRSDRLELKRPGDWWIVLA